MEKINTDYKRRTWKTYTNFFKAQTEKQLPQTNKECKFYQLDNKLWLTLF